MKVSELEEGWSVQSAVIDNTKNPFVYFSVTLGNGEVVEGWMPNPNSDGKGV